MVLRQPRQRPRRGRWRSVPPTSRAVRSRAWPQGLSCPPQGGQASSPATKAASTFPSSLPTMNKAVPPGITRRAPSLLGHEIGRGGPFPSRASSPCRSHHRQRNHAPSPARHHVYCRFRGRPSSSGVSFYRYRSLYLQLRRQTLCVRLDCVVADQAVRRVAWRGKRRPEPSLGASRTSLMLRNRGVRSGGALVLVLS